MAPKASHGVELELDVVVLFDLVCFALTTPVVFTFSVIMGLAGGSGLNCSIS